MSNFIASRAFGVASDLPCSSQSTNIVGLHVVHLHASRQQLNHIHTRIHEGAGITMPGWCGAHVTALV